MEAVAGQLIRRDITPEVAGLRAFRQQVSDEAPELLMRSGDVLTSMQARRELGAVVLMGKDRVGLEHGFEPLAGVAGVDCSLCGSARSTP